jgi:hypothetical protein
MMQCASMSLHLTGAYWPWTSPRWKPALSLLSAAGAAQEKLLRMAAEARVSRPVRGPRHQLPDHSSGTTALLRTAHPALRSHRGGRRAAPTRARSAARATGSTTSRRRPSCASWPRAARSRRCRRRRDSPAPSPGRRRGRLGPAASRSRRRRGPPDPMGSRGTARRGRPGSSSRRGRARRRGVPRVPLARAGRRALGTRRPRPPMRRCSPAARHTHVAELYRID